MFYISIFFAKDQKCNKLKMKVFATVNNTSDFALNIENCANFNLNPGCCVPSP